MQRDNHWISEYQSSSTIFFEIVSMRELNYLKSIVYPFLDKILRKGSSMFVPCGSTEYYIRLLRYTRMLLFINMLHDRWLYTERYNCNYSIRLSWRVAKILCSFKITTMDILQRSEFVRIAERLRINKYLYICLHNSLIYKFHRDDLKWARKLRKNLRKTVFYKLYCI